MKFTIINDLHIGVQRAGGTTPASAQALRAYAMCRYGELLCFGQNIVINGDFFDTYQVPMTDLFDAYLTTANWLDLGDRKLWLIPGNHDLSKNSANLGSFELMAKLLVLKYPDKVKYLPGGSWVGEASGLYAISHVANQELFNLELERVPAACKTLLLHANYDNQFAVEADHSLNLSRDQAKVLTKIGVTIVMGHEHQGRTSLGDKVVIVGNQLPTSVSDCLSHGDGQKDGRKYCLQIDGDDMELVPTWSVSDAVGGYAEIDWRETSQAPQRSFIRVTGKASAAEGAEVIKVISKLRQSSDAFVITNAVKVEGSATDESFAESVEDIRSVDVLEMLIETLDEPQAVVVRKLLEAA